MVYMILPMPKDGSMTLGTTSSTVDGEKRSNVCNLDTSFAFGFYQRLLQKPSERFLGFQLGATEETSPCRVFWNRFTLTMSFVSLNVLPSVSTVNSLFWQIWQQLKTGSDLEKRVFLFKALEGSGCSPGLVEKLLLFSDVAFVAHWQILHDHLCVFLVGLPDGTFVGFKLDDVENFVHIG